MPEANPVDNAVAVLILQHPQEQDRVLGTAKLICATLVHAKLTIGLSWRNLGHALGEPAEAKDWGVLYLGSTHAAKEKGALVALDRKGEMILYNANIPEYLQANRFNHEPRRPRKLLLHAKEIVKLAKGVEREGMTIVPLRIYFNDKGRAKIAIALGKGKKLHDKRETEKVRDWNRDKSRLMREKG